MLSNQLAEAMAGAEARQRIMSEKLGEFVEQVRQLMEQSQGDTKQGLQHALDNLSDRMGVIIEELGSQVRSTSAASKQQQEALASSSQAMVGQFGGQINALVEGVNLTIVEMKAAVQAMRSTTGGALTKLNNGADTLYLAAKDFAKAGEGVTSTLDKSAQVAGQLTQAAGAVSSATTSLSAVFADYQSARNAMVELVGSMQLIVEQARRDAAMSHDVISRIEASTEKLIAAQKQADEYLEKVSEVIAHSHESFSTGMTKAVGEANREFHQALADSVKLLREGIQELEDTLGSVSN
jgi:ABC-type transporter Mla subunit MlaD